MIPEVAFVEFPPKKSGQSLKIESRFGYARIRTILVEKKDVASSKVNGMGGTESSHCAVLVSRLRGRGYSAYSHRRRQLLWVPCSMSVGGEKMFEGEDDSM